MLIIRNGRISLSLRTILELQLFFTENYPDFLSNCSVCRDIIFSKYQECQGEDCTLRMHYYCIDKKFAQSNHPKCTGCQTELVPTRTSQTSSRITKTPASKRSTNSTNSPVIVIETPVTKPRSKRTMDNTLTRSTRRKNVIQDDDDD